MNRHRQPPIENRHKRRRTLSHETFEMRRLLTAIGDLGRGIAVADDAVGSGYIMYSEESVFDRFAANPPLANNSQHLIAVQYDDGTWTYSDNWQWISFSPIATDRLLAEIDFDVDMSTSLEGASGSSHGITLGYAEADLTFAANMWNNKYNAGEFMVTGTFFDDAIGGPTFVPVGEINRGIATDDRATGTGYILHSPVSLFTRFAANPPHPSNSHQLITVRFANGSWQYNDNTLWHNFTIDVGDRLLASVDFDADTILSLQGSSGQVYGVEQGFDDGDLSFLADWWNGAPNNGEFSVAGTYFTVDQATLAVDITSIETDTGTARDFVTNDSELSISGTLSNATELTVTVDGTTYKLGRHPQLTLDAEGNWLLKPFSLDHGSYLVTAEVMNAQGESELATQTILMDLVPPNINVTDISEDTGTPNDFWTSDQSLVIAGTFEPGDLLTIDIDGTSYALGNAPELTTDGNGNWALDLTNVTLGTNSYLIIANAWDEAGNLSVVTQPVVVELTGAPSIQELHVTPEVGTRHVNGTALAVDSDSTSLAYEWDFGDGSSSVSGADLKMVNHTYETDGEFTVTLTVTDGTGGTDITTETLTISTPPAVFTTIDGVIDDSAIAGDFTTNDRNIAVFGTYPQDSSLQIDFDGTSYFLGNDSQVTSDGNGNWVLDLTEVTLFDGSASIVVTAQDVDSGETAASSQMIVIDTVAPVVTVDSLDQDTGTPGDFITIDASPIVFGIFTPGSSLEVSVDSNVYQLGTDSELTHDGSGNWTLDLSSIALAGGSRNVIATATDLAGNSTMDVQPLNIAYAATLVGSLGGGIAVDDTTTGTGYIMYTEQAVHQRFVDALPLSSNADHLIAVQFENDQWHYNTNSEWIAFTPAPSDRLLVAVDFEDGTVVSLDEVRGEQFGIDRGFASGDLEFEPNSWNGKYNAGEFGVTGTFFNVANVAVTFDSIMQDTGLVGDMITSDQQVSLAGTFTEGGSLTITAAGTTYALGANPELTSDGNGNWMLDLSAVTLPEGPHAVTGDVVDTAGNMSSVTSEFTVDIDGLFVDIDRVEPDSAQIGDFITNRQHLRLSGNVTGASTLGVDIDGTSYSLGNDPELSLDAAGRWTLDLSETTLSAGSYTISAHASDGVGNSVDDTTSLVVDLGDLHVTVDGVSDDTRTPGDFVTHDQTLSFTGTFTPGNALTVAVNAQLYSLGTDSELTDDGNGTWTLDLSAMAFAPHDYEVVATVSDMAGNVSIATQSIVVTSDEQETALDLQAAIEQAINNGDASLTIAPGEYRIDSISDNDAILQIESAHDLEIIANGVTFIATTLKQILDVDTSSNLTIRGLTIDYDPLPFTQGTVISKAPDNSWFDIQIHSGYDVTTVLRRIIFYDPVTRLLKNNMRVRFEPSITQISSDVLHIETGPLDDALAVGDLVALTKNSLTQSHSVHIAESDHVSIVDVALHSSVSFAFYETHSNANSYTNVRVERGPTPIGATEPRLLSGLADGLHSSHATIGPTIEDSYFSSQADDAIAINTEFTLIGDQPDPQTLIVAAKRSTDGLPFVVGDVIRGYNRTTGRSHDATVLSIVPDDSVDFAAIQNTYLPDLLRSNWFKIGFLVTLDSPIDVGTGDLLASPDRTGGGFVVRNTTIENHPGRGIHVKASDGLIENNTIDGSSGVGIAVTSEPLGWAEGSFGENVDIFNNVITNTGGQYPKTASNQVAAISVTTDDEWIGRDHRYINIVGNTVSHAVGPNLIVTHTDGVTIQNNQFFDTHQADTPAGFLNGVKSSAVVWLDNVDNVVLNNNSVFDFGPHGRSLLSVSSNFGTITGLDDGIRFANTITSIVTQSHGNSSKDFQPDTPAEGWSYLWNSNGAIGDPGHYEPLLPVFGGGQYTADGTTTPNSGGFLNLRENRAHPGDAANATVPHDRYVILAFTVGKTAEYELDGFLQTNTDGNGLDFVIHVDGAAPSHHQIILNDSEVRLEIELGTLTEGDVIYVGFGPNGSQSSDTFEFDFSIDEYLT